MSDTTRKRWILWVNGYGAWTLLGSEEEAEAARSHKAKHEGAIGKKCEVPRWLFEAFARTREAEIAFAVRAEKAEAALAAKGKAQK